MVNNELINLESGIKVQDSDNIVIKNNTLSVRYWGIYGSNGSGVHKYLNNTITKTNSEWFAYATNMENVIIDSNNFIGLGTDNNNRGIYINNSAAEITHNTVVTPGRSIHIENQAGTIIGNNTLISTNQGDYGIYITNLSTPSVLTILLMDMKEVFMLNPQFLIIIIHLLDLIYSME